MTITTGQIDMHGLNGREHHPLATDSGKTMVVRSFFNDPYITAEMEGVAKDSDDVELVGAFGFFVCTTEDGRLVEIAEYEVASVQLNNA